MSYKMPENVKHSIIECAPGVLNRFPVLFAYLYGSYATGVAHAFSDADIAIYIFDRALMADEKLMRLEADISLAFDDSLDYRVVTDVRALNDATLVLKGEIVTEGILIYSKNETKRIEFETNARMAYFDFHPVIKAYYDAYAESVLTKKQ